MAYLGSAPKKGQFFNRFEGTREKQDSEFVKRFLDVRHSVNARFDEDQDDLDEPLPMISPVNKESVTSLKSPKEMDWS